MTCPGCLNPEFHTDELKLDMGKDLKLRIDINIRYPSESGHSKDLRSCQMQRRWRWFSQNATGSNATAAFNGSELVVLHLAAWG
jgi:hypothetical protein